MRVSDVLTLNSRAVAQHEITNIRSRRSRVNRSSVPSTHQIGKSPDVIIVTVGDDHGVERVGIEGELAIQAFRIDSIRVEQPTIEQDSMSTDFEQVGAPCDLPGRSVKRDSQPTTSSRPRLSPRENAAVAPRVPIDRRIVPRPFPPAANSMLPTIEAVESPFRVDRNQGITSTSFYRFHHDTKPPRLQVGQIDDKRTHSLSFSTLLIPNTSKEFPWLPKIHASISSLEQATSD